MGFCSLSVNQFEHDVLLLASSNAPRTPTLRPFKARAKRTNLKVAQNVRPVMSTLCTGFVEKLLIAQARLADASYTYMKLLRARDTQHRPANAASHARPR